MNSWTRILCALGAVSAAGTGVAGEIFHPVRPLSAVTLGGYVDTSAVWLMGDGNGLPGRSFDGSDRQDGFNLNAVKLQLEKPLEDGGWSAGYAVGLVFGADAQVIGTSWIPLPDAAVKNAHVSLRAPVGNGLDFKLGVWDTLAGYEVFESGNNPNYSRSFGYFIEPVVHTGLLAAYPLNDVFTVSAGVANRGDSNIINSRSGVETLKSYLGGVTLAQPEEASVLPGASWSACVLDHGVADGADVFHFYTGATVPLPWKKLALGAAYDCRANGLSAGSYENALAGYALFQAAENLKINARLDYASGTDGAYGVTAAPGAGNVKLLGATLTLDYSRWANVVSRVEARWDRSLTGQGIYLDGDARNAVSLALNVIYKF